MAKYLVLFPMEPAPEPAVVEAAAVGIADAFGIVTRIEDRVLSMKGVPFLPVSSRRTGEHFNTYVDEQAFAQLERETQDYMSFERVMGLVGVPVLLDGENRGLFSSGIAGGRRSVVAAGLGLDQTVGDVTATAVHETMHMFGIDHCDTESCAMYWAAGPGQQKKLCPTCAERAKSASTAVGALGALGGLAGSIWPEFAEASVASDWLQTVAERDLQPCSPLERCSWVRIPGALWDSTQSRRDDVHVYSNLSPVPARLVYFTDWRGVRGPGVRSLLNTGVAGHGSTPVAALRDLGERLARLLSGMDP